VTSEKDKLLLGCWANNEALPFADNSFDCYIACLSLMLVDNYEAQLSEAFRVMEKGATCGFNVWGREENLHMFSIFINVFKNNGLTYEDLPLKPHFHLSNMEML